MNPIIFICGIGLGFFICGILFIIILKIATRRLRVNGNHYNEKTVELMIERNALDRRIADNLDVLIRPPRLCDSVAKTSSQTIESVAVEIARRLPALQLDSEENNAHLITNLLRQAIYP